MSTTSADSIARKLRVDICPFLVTARHLHQAWSYRIYTAYSYLGELFVLLAGIGIANPVMAFLSGNDPAAGTGTGETPLGHAMANFGWFGAALLLVWVLVKLYVRKEDLEKRCSLVASYRRQCAQLEHNLRKALSEDDPMPALLELQRKLSDLVDRHIAEGSLDGVGIAATLKDQVESHCRELIGEFQGHWKLPAGGARQ